MTDQPKPDRTEAEPAPDAATPASDTETPADTGQADYGSAGQQAIEEGDDAFGRDR